MYLVASKYNNELFHVKINTCLRYRFVVRCESTTCLFDKLGKKYIELRILDPTFQAVVVDIFDLMNTKFNTNISPTGLTASESAYLTNEEKTMKLKSRGKV